MIFIPVILGKLLTLLLTPDHSGLNRPNRLFVELAFGLGDRGPK